MSKLSKEHAKLYLEIEARIPEQETYLHNQNLSPAELITLLARNMVYLHYQKNEYDCLFAAYNILAAKYCALTGIPLDSIISQDEIAFENVLISKQREAASEGFDMAKTVNATKGALAKNANDKTQQIKAKVKSKWFEWQKDKTLYKTAVAFAAAIMDEFDLSDSKTIENWCTKWRKEQKKEKNNSASTEVFSV